ncbi:MAG: DUF2514 family protein [Variovorax sp.]
MTWALANWKWLAMVGLLALLGVQQVRVDRAQTQTAEARTELADFKTVQAQVAQIAEQEARAEESRRESAKREEIDRARKETEVAEAAARSADAAAASLRSQLTRYVAASRGTPANPQPATGSPTAEDPIGVLAIVLERIDDRAGILARTADAARIAGQACERYADRLQPDPAQVNP